MLMKVLFYCSTLLLLTVFSSCGFQRPKYVHGWYGNHSNAQPEAPSAFRNEKNTDQEEMGYAEGPRICAEEKLTSETTPVAVAQDTIAPPKKQESVVAIPDNPAVRQQIEKEADFVMGSGIYSLAGPVVNLVLSYLFSNSSSYYNGAFSGFLVTFLFALSLLAVLYPIIRGTQLLKYVSPQDQSDSVRKIRMGKKLAIISLIVRAALVILGLALFFVALIYMSY